jgi:hypothetical protein
LIAAVLLIVVVVGIGAVVTSIVRSLVTENQETIRDTSVEMKCSRDVNVEAIVLDGIYQVCKGTDYVTAVIENIGGEEIDDFQIRIFTASGIFKNESVSADDPLSPGEAQEVNTTFTGFTAADILQVSFTPKLKKGAGQYVFCSDVSLKFEEILDC